MLLLRPPASIFRPSQPSEWQCRARELQLPLQSFNASPPLAGIGSALLSTLLNVLRSRGASKLVVFTTNDNVNALRFYQRRGFRLTALRPNAMEEARKLKPSVPIEGRHRIKLYDELVLTLAL